MYKLRKNRRIIALIMAFALIFAFMAINASAATPRGLVNCLDCNGTQTTTTRLTQTRTETVSGCTSISGYHLHNVKYEYYRTYCQSCGYSYNHSYKVISSTCHG